MKIPLSISPKVRIVLSKLGSLILLLQKSPIIQMILPEARVAGVAGVGEIAKWSVAVVAGLGVFDSVAGATTLTQLAPSPGSLSVPATSGQSLSFTVQLTGTPYTRDIKYWTTSGTMPSGLTGAKNPVDPTFYTISGIPNQTGSFPIRTALSQSAPPSASLWVGTAQRRPYQYIRAQNRFAACRESARLLILISDAVQCATSGDLFPKFQFSGGHFRDEFIPLTTE